MTNTFNTEGPVLGLEIPIRRIEELRKDIRKYEEHVNKCDIYKTNVLSDGIGTNIDFLKHSSIRITEEQKREIEILESAFRTNMINLNRCRCVRKLEK